MGGAAWKKQADISDKDKKIAIGILSVVSLLIAVSPHISFNDICLVEYKLPEMIENIWGIFRITGRFAWLIVYPMMFFTICCGKQRDRKYTIVLSICLALQLIDIAPGIEKKQQDMQTITYDNTLKDTIWGEILQRDSKRHIYFANQNTNLRDMFLITNWAIENGMTVNRFYFARNLDKEKIGERLMEALDEKREDAIFVTNLEETAILEEAEVNYYLTIDNIVLGNVQ